MNQRRHRNQEFVLHATLVAIVAALLFLACSISAQGAINDCIDATCRVRAGDGGTGTGCCFSRDAEHIYVLTNAHVATTETVECEFWREGYQSRPLAGRTVWRQIVDAASRDVAIVAVPIASFDGILPAIVPLAEEEQAPIGPASTVVSVGCASGAWATAWKGHVLRTEDEGGQVHHFQPPPLNGRSGSALFNADGTAIVGLIGWRSQDDSYGVAMSLGELMAAFRGEPVRVASRNTHVRTDTSALDTTGWRSGGGPAAHVGLTRRYRRRPEAQYCEPGRPCPPGRLGPNQGGGGGQGGQVSPWPGLPLQPLTTGPSPEEGEGSEYATREELAAVEDGLSKRLLKLQMQAETDAASAVAAVGQVAEHVEDQIGEERAETEELIAVKERSILERLTETRERIESKVASVTSTVSEVKGSVEEGRSVSGLATTLVGGILGLGAVQSLGLGAVLWIVERRVRKRFAKKKLGATGKRGTTPASGAGAADTAITPVPSNIPLRPVPAPTLGSYPSLGSYQPPFVEQPGPKPPIAQPAPPPAPAPVAPETRTETRYVRVPQINAEGEAYREAMRREAGISGEAIVPYLERIESVKDQLLHGQQVVGTAPEKSAWKQD